MSVHPEGHWSEWVRECESLGHPYVIVTMLGVRGSTPRDAGTKMVVSAKDFRGTIGGGELEFQALKRAQELLGDGIAGQWVENFPLGEKLGQCCGGSTSLLFEQFVPVMQPLYLFGAGHVGRALAPVLAALPMNTQWVDARCDEFPDTLPPGVKAVHPEEPVDVVKAAPIGSYFLIMTHQHPLDYALMEAALRREDAAYIGVIGSKSKWRRFKLRLEHRGFGEDAISTIHCPIGLSAVPGKRPAEIAVSVAAQVIAHYHARQLQAPANAGPGWKQLQAQLNASQSSLATSGSRTLSADDEGIPSSSPRGGLYPRSMDAHSTKVK